MMRFGTLLKHHIAASGRSISAWARMVGITQGFASNLMAGRRTPPLRELEAWADSLALADEERQRFLDLAAIAHLPAAAQARLVDLLEDAAGLRMRLQLLGGEVPAAGGGQPAIGLRAHA
jgi:hypothetical protein